MNIYRFFFLFFAVFLVKINTAHAGNTLVLGDSHVVGAFGHQLDHLLREKPGEVVETYGVCGSVARYFFTGTRSRCGYYSHVSNHPENESSQQRTPLIGDLIERFKPDTVVVGLGTNYGPSGWTAAGMRSDMRILAQAIIKSGVKCYWVSMPDTRTFKNRQATILKATEAAVTPGCEFIDSTQLTSYPAHSGGGIHYDTASTRPLAKAWAESVYLRIKN